MTLIKIYKYASIILLLFLISCDYDDIYIPPSGDIISYREIYLEAIKQLAVNEDDVYISDYTYKFYTKEDLEKFLSADDTDKVLYNEYWDCDDRALRLVDRVKVALPGVPLGISWIVYFSGGNIYSHAINIFYNFSDKMFYFIYPEDDRIERASYKYYVVLLLL